MVPPRSDRISRVPPYSRIDRRPYPYGAVTLFGATFQNASGSPRSITGLVRVRSPLLTESRLMSFPPVTEMFQFTGFASRGYGFTARYRRSGGFPHSEIPGSKPARGSPGLVATCYVLHRLSVPRHPPNALLALESRDFHVQTSACRRIPQSQPVGPDTCRSCGACRRWPDARPLHDVKQRRRRSAAVAHSRSSRAGRSGGGERNRTDDLLLAKQALSRLSYTPAFVWWAWVDSNYRPHAYQACALTD